MLIAGRSIDLLSSILKNPGSCDDSLAKQVADGRPWEMYVVKRNRSNILVLRPNGRGTISDGANSITPTWWAIPDGICIKPEGVPERCLRLARTKAGIAASQNGRIIFILKR
jgi:hypothetical protein